VLRDLRSPRRHRSEQRVGRDAAEEEDRAEHVQRFQHRHLSSIYGAARL